MSTKLETTQILNLAKLAQIAVCPKEDSELLVEFTNSVDKIWGMIEQIEGVDTSGVEPMAHPIDTIQLMRADEILIDSQRDSLMSLAPNSDGQHYLLPKVL